MKLSRAPGLSIAVSACGGDSKDSAHRGAEAQKALQQGIQKEQKMIEGMVKGVETLKKKAAEAKEETRK
ncbi:MAG TPA: hypothetical protein VLE20_14975 [Blastocatellia bacterium]|nr:hypothetical protein [Blastocatellia bacterium]